MTASPAASAAVLPMVLKLIRMRWQISFNGFRRARLVTKIFTILGLLALAAFAGLVFWLSWKMVGLLQSPELAQYVGDTIAFIKAIPVLFFAVYFLGILLTSFGVLLQALYLSGDMDFLLAAPVPIRAVFTTKLLQAVLPNFGLSALFGLPVLFGLGAAGNFNFLYYLLTPLMMVALSLAAAGLAGLVVMLVARIFPPRRVAEVLGFFGAIFSIICSQTGNLMNSGADNADVSSEQINTAVGWMTQLNNPWLPLNWAGRGLVALGEGSWLPGIGLTLLSLGAAVGLFWISLETAERWYYTGWARMQVVSRKKRPVHTGRPLSESAGWGWLQAITQRLLSAPVRGIVWKDFLVLRRDLRHLSQLITPLIFGVIYGIMFLLGEGEPPTGRGEAPEWFMNSLSTILVYGNIGISIFVGWALLQRLAGMGFSAEGKNYWVLKAAPISARQMLTAKFVVAYLPTFILSLLFLTTFSILQKVGIGQVAYSILVLALCLAGMAGILLAFGAAGANFNWEDPRRMNAGNMGCVGMILTALYVPLDLALFLGPLVLIGVFGITAWQAYLAGGVLGTGLSLLCLLLPPYLLEARVNHLGEE